MQLCVTYARSRQGFVRAELVKRGALSRSDWQLVEARKIGIEMTELALMCSWGATERNRTIGSWGVHNQYVYREHQFVYVENGVVTSWQD